MKKCLFAIVLLYPGQYASADATFILNSLIPENSRNTLTYFIKNDQLKYTESSSNKTNIFNQSLQQFVTLDKKDNKASTLNQKILEQHLLQLNKQRMQKLEIVEKELSIKTRDMSAIQQQAAESLINQLKYPDLYGEHTLLTIKPIHKKKQINNIECTQFQLYKNDKLLKEHCMAAPQTLGISNQEYLTLRGFYSFGYKMQSAVMIAMGKTNFTMIDFEQHNMPGVVIETIGYKDNNITYHQVLHSISTETLSNSIFKLENTVKTQ